MCVDLVALQVTRCQQKYVKCKKHQNLQASMTKCKISKRQNSFNRAHVRSHIFTAESMKNSVLWNVIPCSLVEIQHFAEPYTDFCDMFYFYTSAGKQGFLHPGRGEEISFSLKMGPHSHNSGRTVQLKGCSHFCVSAFLLEVNMVPLLFFRQIVGASMWHEFAHPDFSLTPDSVLNYHTIHWATITQQALDNGLQQQP